MTSDGRQNGNSTRLSPPAVLALLAVLWAFLSRSVLHDGDTYTHIAAGRWMVEHWSVLDADPLSATFAGQPWNAHEWLSEVLLALAYRADGLTGVLLLTAAALAVTFFNLARHVGATAGQRATMILVMGALVCVMPSILARPHILALPLLEMWVAELLVARRKRRMPGWWLVPVMAVWANLHGGFAFGLVIGIALAVEASMEVACRWHVIWSWWSVLAAATFICLLTPQGWDGLVFPLRLLQLHSLAVIAEWQPVDFSRDHTLESALLGLVALLATGRVKLPWLRMLMLLGLIHLSLAHARHSVLFGIAGALMLAEPVGRAFVEVRSVALRPAGRVVCWAGVGLIILLRLAFPIEISNSRATPVAAVAQVPPNVVGMRFLNSDQFGGYLALVGLHPFIDGRLELFGDAFVSDFLAMSQPDGERLRHGIEQYGIEWAILALEDPLVARFDGLAGWRRQYADGVAVVFIRG